MKELLNEKDVNEQANEPLTEEPVAIVDKDSITAADLELERADCVAEGVESTEDADALVENIAVEAPKASITADDLLVEVSETDEVHTEQPEEIDRQENGDDNPIQAIEELGKPKLKKTRRVISILVILGLLLSSGIGYIIHRVTFREDINVFDYLEYQFAGMNEDATIEDTLVIPPTSERLGTVEMREFAEQVTIAYSQSDGLKNGDVITATLNPDDVAFKNFKYNPTELTMKIAVEGLKSIPQSWDDVQQKEAIYDEIEPIAASFHDAIQTGMDQGSSIGYIETTKKHIATYYLQGDNATCYENLRLEYTTGLRCGSAFLVYEMEIHLPAGYYFTNGTPTKFYFPFVASGIVNNEDGTTDAKLNYGEIMDEFTDEKSSFETIEEKILAHGFKKF